MGLRKKFPFGKSNSIQQYFHFMNIFTEYIGTMGYSLLLVFSCHWYTTRTPQMQLGTEIFHFTHHKKKTFHKLNTNLIQIAVITVSITYY